MQTELDLIRTKEVLVHHNIRNKEVDFSHRHREYEILCLIGGDGTYTIGKHTHHLKSGIVLIGGDEEHRIQYRPGVLSSSISIHFTEEVLDAKERALFLPLFYSSLIYYHNRPIKGCDIEFFIKSLTECKKARGDLQVVTLKNRLAALLSALALDGAADEGASPLDTGDYHSDFPLYNNSSESSRQIFIYISDHLDEPHSLESLCEKFNLSQKNLNTLFKREAGTTPSRFIRNLRLYEAQQLIRKGEKSENACFAVGFNDYSNFYRSYKALFGDAPSRSN